MLLVDLVAVSLTSRDSNRIDPSSKYAKVMTSIIMVSTLNCNIHYCYGEQKTILSELVLIIIMFFPRILILVQYI